MLTNGARDSVAWARAALSRSHTPTKPQSFKSSIIESRFCSWSFTIPANKNVARRDGASTHAAGDAHSAPPLPPQSLTWSPQAPNMEWVCVSVWALELDCWSWAWHDLQGTRQHHVTTIHRWALWSIVTDEHCQHCVSLAWLKSAPRCKPYTIRNSACTRSPPQTPLTGSYFVQDASRS